MYRPISNLPVLSKLLERLIAKQLLDSLTTFWLLPDQQSAYRAYHSTETVVQKVLSDILLAVDSGDLTVLTLLDLLAWNSAASTRGVIWPCQSSPLLVHITLGWLSPVHSMWVKQVGDETRALRRASRVGPWTDPVPAIHSGVDTAN